MNAAICFLYALVLTWLVTKTPFFLRSGLTKKQLVFIFLAKLSIAILYGLYFSQPVLRHVGDTWRFYDESIPETEKLLANPLRFISDLFIHGYNQAGGLFSSTNSYWNDLKTNLFLKSLALLNVVTNNNYYANAFILNYLFMFGTIATYRLFTNWWKTNQALLITLVFFVPSFTFWYTGLHKDGLIFTSLSLAVYLWFRFLTRRHFPLLLLLLFLFCCVCLFAYKNFVALALLPFFISSYLCLKKRHVSLFYLVCIGIMTLLKLIGVFDFAAVIAQKQQDFSSLEGNSQLPLPALTNHFHSIIKYFPHAINNALFQPQFLSLHSAMHWLSFAENAVVFAMLMLLFYQARKFNAVQFSLLLFCFSYLLIIGYTVTLSGAIMRYKALIYPLLLPMAFIHITNFSIFAFGTKRSVFSAT